MEQIIYLMPMNLKYKKQFAQANKHACRSYKNVFEKDRIEI